MNRQWTRLVVATVAITLLVACTKRIPINPDVAVAERKVDGLVEIHLRDGRMILTQDVAVTDSTFVVSSLREGGRRVPVDPIVIPHGDVESIERLKGDMLAAVVVAGTVGLFFGFILWAFASSGWPN